MSHWYLPDGTPYYTMVGKNGAVRDVTLRDARKVNAAFSVTTVIGQLDKPSLTQWKLKQLLGCALEKAPTLPKDWNSDRWSRDVWDLYRERTEVYSKQGSKIHDQLEQYYIDKSIQPMYEDMLMPAIELLDKEINDPLGNYIPEQSFTSKEGFGGKIDLQILTNGGVIIVDFKTKQGDQLSANSIYDDYIMQLAAYKHGIEEKGYKVIGCANLLISTTHEGVSYYHQHKAEDIEHGYQMFKHLLEFCKLKNNYWPKICEVDN